MTQAKMDWGEHVPVLFYEALDALDIKEDGVYLDGTFGRGGHSAGMLERLGRAGRLIAIDKDPQAIAVAKERFASDARFSIVRGSFAMLGQIVEDRQIVGGVDGVFLDLGVSSPQLDQAERGFSFLRNGPLDMRMDPDVGESAEQWLSRAKHGEIAHVLKFYGDERFAGRIATHILRAREAAPIQTTGQLAQIISDAVPRHEKGKHPATRSFQAIRIHINQELDDLKQALSAAVDVLKPGGRLAVISFHSLEDRMVKRFIRDEARGKDYASDLPIPDHMIQRRLKALGRDIRPGKDELERNPRARSSVLRVAERLKDSQQMDGGAQ